MLLHSLLFFSLVAAGGRALTVSHRPSDLESPVVEIAYAGYQRALEGNVQRFLGIRYPAPVFVQNTRGRELTVDFRVGDLRLRRFLPILHFGSLRQYYSPL